jgi:hypothetical protein
VCGHKGCCRPCKQNVCDRIIFLNRTELDGRHQRIAFAGNSNRFEDYSIGFISQIVHMQKIMINASNTMKKQEKLQSKGQQQEKTYKQDVHGTDTELSKGTKSERERSTKRPSTGA